VLGIAGGVIGSELSLTGVLLCSSMWVIGGAGLLARLGRSIRRPHGKRAGPVAVYILIFGFSFYYFHRLNVVFVKPISQDL
jgi:hypothetical protein